MWKLYYTRITTGAGKFVRNIGAPLGIEDLSKKGEAKASQKAKSLLIEEESNGYLTIDIHLVYESTLRF